MASDPRLDVMCGAGTWPSPFPEHSPGQASPHDEPGRVAQARPSAPALVSPSEFAVQAHLVGLLWDLPEDCAGLPLQVLC